MTPVLNIAFLLEDPTSVPQFGYLFAKMFAMLVLLVALMLLSFWALKRLFLRRGVLYAPSIQILERKWISQKTSLLLVSVRGKELLLSESQFEVRQIQFPKAGCSHCLPTIASSQESVEKETPYTI